MEVNYIRPGEKEVTYHLSRRFANLSRFPFPLLEKLRDAAGADKEIEKQAATTLAG